MLTHTLWRCCFSQAWRMTWPWLWSWAVERSSPISRPRSPTSTADRPTRIAPSNAAPLAPLPPSTTGWRRAARTTRMKPCRWHWPAACQKWKRRREKLLSTPYQVLWKGPKQGSIRMMCTQKAMCLKLKTPLSLLTGRLFQRRQRKQRKRGKAELAQSLKSGVRRRRRVSPQTPLQPPAAPHPTASRSLSAKPTTAGRKRRRSAPALCADSESRGLGDPVDPNLRISSLNTLILAELGTKKQSWIKL